MDLASDKVGSRALVDLVRYNFSDGCEIYFVLLVSSLLYSILNTPFNCRNHLDIPRTLGHQKFTREQILVHEIIAEARIQFPQRMISSSTEFTQLASILRSSKTLIHTSPLPPSPPPPPPLPPQIIPQLPTYKPCARRGFCASSGSGESCDSGCFYTHVYQHSQNENYN